MKALQAMVDICVSFAEQYDIIYNAKKTASMFFWPRGYKNSRYNPSHLGAQMRRFVNETTHLGYRLSTDLKDDLDMPRQVRSFIATSNTLIRSFGKYPDAVKCELFRAYCEQM